MVYEGEWCKKNRRFWQFRGLEEKGKRNYEAGDVPNLMGKVIGEKGAHTLGSSRWGFQIANPAF